MLSYITIGLVALLASGLTMYSGFGLGTILLPVFALFFPIEAAVAATAAVHGANNVFKVSLLGKYADRSLVLKFGVPAILAAFAGAALLGYMAHFGQVASYTIGSRTAVITPLKLLLGLLMFIFALFELLPRFKQLTFSKDYLFLGGIISGFFGGLSGHQGALRSAFLAKVGITAQAFVGTNAWIGFMVDAARISVYAYVFFLSETGDILIREQTPLILTGIVFAFAGVLIGKRFLHKITMTFVQTLTGILLMTISFALAAGLI